MSPAEAQDPGLTPTELEALAAIREADLGIERDYLDLTRYTYLLPADLAAETEQTQGAQTWVYDGQQVYDDDPEPVSVGSWWTPETFHAGADSDPEGYYGVGVATRVDQYGRRWLLDYVDLDEVQRMHEDYDADLLEQFGQPEAAAEYLVGSGPDAEASVDSVGTEEWVEPTSWTKITCSGTDQIWQHDDWLATMADSLNPRARKVLFSPTQGCSATMVDNRWALTAAHCVSDGAGNEYPHLGMIWCSLENLDENIDGSYVPGCYGTDTITLAPAWDGTNYPTYDYAVIKLSAAPGVGHMGLSSASRLYIAGFTDYARGLPGKTSACADNLVTDNALTTADAYDGRQMYGASGSVAFTVWPLVTRYRTSTALGMSGGPHYYCPNPGGCSAGHYISAVQSTITVSGCTGSSCASGYSAGPSANVIRSWVIVETP